LAQGPGPAAAAALDWFAVSPNSVNALEAAEGLLKALMERYPTHPVVLGNLAAVHSSRGETEEAEALLRRCVEANPDYLFGRCNLARLLLLRDDTEGAQALLDGLEQQESLHVQDAFALYGSRALLYKLKGDGEAAEQSLRALAGIVEHEDEQREYENLRNLVDRIGSPLGRALRGLKALT